MGRHRVRRAQHSCHGCGLESSQAAQRQSQRQGPASLPGPSAGHDPRPRRWRIRPRRSKGRHPGYRRAGMSPGGTVTLPDFERGDLPSSVLVRRPGSDGNAPEGKRVAANSQRKFAGPEWHRAEGHRGQRCAFDAKQRHVGRRVRPTIVAVCRSPPLTITVTPPSSASASSAVTTKFGRHTNPLQRERVDSTLTTLGVTKATVSARAVDRVSSGDGAVSGSPN
jgi:hypothetical protein